MSHLAAALEKVDTCLTLHPGTEGRVFGKLRERKARLEYRIARRQEAEAALRETDTDKRELSAVANPGHPAASSSDGPPVADQSRPLVR
jgi:hypothetical protein